MWARARADFEADESDMSPWNALAGFVREHFHGELSVERNLSIAARLVKRWGIVETSHVVEGAALLGWKDLRGLNGPDGIGFRWAKEAYWRDRNKRQNWKPPEPLKQIFKEMGK